jgi:hypothetical protein
MHKCFLVAILALLWVSRTQASTQVDGYYSTMHDKSIRFIDRRARLDYQDCIDHVKIKHKEGASEDPRFQKDLEGCARKFKSRVIKPVKDMLPDEPVI